MISIFKKIVKQKSQETAIKYGKQIISYEELDHLSDLIAQLILNSGHTPEDSPFIGLYSSRTLYTVPMMIGIWKAGFAYVPMDPKYSSERIDYILDDCNLKMILTDCNAPVTDYPQVQWLNINTSSLSDVTPYPIHADQGRYAYVIYTSGTTGKPKGIPITHVSLCNLIEAHTTSRERYRNMSSKYCIRCFCMGDFLSADDRNTCLFFQRTGKEQSSTYCRFVGGATYHYIQCHPYSPFCYTLSSVSQLKVSDICRRTLSRIISA